MQRLYGRLAPLLRHGGAPLPRAQGWTSPENRRSVLGSRAWRRRLGSRLRDGTELQATRRGGRARGSHHRRRSHPGDASRGEGARPMRLASTTSSWSRPTWRPTRHRPTFPAPSPRASWKRCRSTTPSSGRSALPLPGGGRLVSYGLKHPNRWPEWLITLGIGLTKPFGVDRDYESLKPRLSIERHLHMTRVPGALVRGCLPGRWGATLALCAGRDGRRGDRRGGDMSRVAFLTP